MLHIMLQERRGENDREWGQNSRVGVDNFKLNINFLAVL
jgi:hypothetical protein